MTLFNEKYFRYGSWIESSKLEISLAKEISVLLYSRTKDQDTLINSLECIAERCLEGKCNDSFIDDIYDQYIKVNNFNFSIPFPSSESSLSSNFFGKIALEIGRLMKDPAQHGVVGTPSAMALDMVLLSIIYFLSVKHEEDPATILDRLYNCTDYSPEKEKSYLSTIENIEWYDPCIGSGVFPISIVLLMCNLGVNINLSCLSRINGSELDPLASSAAEIRLAILLSHICDLPYTEVRYKYKNHFNVRDSLFTYTQQKGMYEDINRSFDIVVGNPPYVRADRLSPNYKKYLKASYPSVANGTVDLYNYFIAHGMTALKENGILTYISPAGFQKSKSGKKTRSFISQHGSLRALFDFDELNVFQEASVHPSVYVIQKHAVSSDIVGYSYDELPSHSPLIFGVLNSFQIPNENISSDGWLAEYSEAEAVLKYISRNSRPLIDYCGRILSGVKTGCKRAYFLPPKLAEELLKDHDTFLKPLILPVAIKKWRPKWDGSYLLLIKKGVQVPDNSPIMRHLLLYEEVLRKRSDIIGEPVWYSLRSCNYYDSFSKPKIVFPDIASDCRFAMDTKGYFIPDGAFFIPREDYALLGILNSCVGRYYFKARCNSIGNPNTAGRLRFKKTYVEKFPIPIETENNKILFDKISDISKILVDAPDDLDKLSALDSLVLELYDMKGEYLHFFRRHS